MSSARSGRAALIQLSATQDKEANFAAAERLIRTAKAAGAKVVFLPECVDFVGRSREESVALAEDPTAEDGLLSRYRALAKQLGLWFSLGGLHEKSPGAAKGHLSHVLVSADGDVASRYVKTHLFDIDIPGKVTLRESEFSDPGARFEKPVETPLGRIGLGICYDIRFPLMSQWLRESGAEILTFPSAFTVSTGQAHWEALLRARAIETQSYVVAAAQSGQHNEKRASYGHSMIVDPWGRVVAEISDEGEGIALAELDMDAVAKVREQMPVWSHQRRDLVHMASGMRTGLPIESQEVYDFGGHNIPAAFVFLRSRLSFAFVNRKPVLPGHALISSLRKVEKLTELTAEEVSDIFITAQTVQKLLEHKFGTKSTTLNVQDGELAGQSVKHVHIHLLPRHEGDFQNNDDIYVTLSSHDKGPQTAADWRSPEVMSAEAAEFRALLALQSAKATSQL